MSEIEITSIEIKVDKETIKLSIENARILFDKLKELFEPGRKEDALDLLRKIADKPAPYIPPVIIKRDWYPIYPNVPNRPIWIKEDSTTGTPLPEPVYTWCCDLNKLNAGESK